MPIIALIFDSLDEIDIDSFGIFFMIKTFDLVLYPCETKTNEKLRHFAVSIVK